MKKPKPVYYRNKVNVTSTEGIFVDAFSLWERKGQLMVLVDDDQYATLPYSAEFFNFVELH